MSNELVIHYPTGATLYAQLLDATGQVWNGSAFAAPGSAAWTDYDIAMTESATATGIYRASMPAAAAGVYGWVVYKQKGGSPAVTDGPPVGTGRIEWDGTAEIMPASTTNITGGTINSVSGTVTLADDGITSAKLADSAIAEIAAAITGLSASQIGDAVLDEVVEGAYTLRQMMRLVAASLAGASSGGGTTEVTFTGLDGSTPRIVATVDASGNRTAVTKTVT